MDYKWKEFLDAVQNIILFISTVPFFLIFLPGAVFVHSVAGIILWSLNKRNLKGSKSYESTLC